MTTSYPATDPAIYTIEIDELQSLPLPSTPAEWRARASHVASILARDAAARDIANASPRAEVALLKASGLLKVLGPAKYGGGGQSWEVGYQVIRDVAKGDGSLGMLLGYSLLWSTIASVVGTEEQKERFGKLITEGNFFVGGAVNPRDSDLKATDHGDHLVFEGFKHFNTGGVVSDVTVLEGVEPSTSGHIFAIVETHQPGMQFGHDWDNIGLRLSESGSVKIDKIKVPWSDALGWSATSKNIEPILNTAFASLLLPTIQLVFSNFYLGIAQGALDTAAQYTATKTRPWPFGGDNKESATEEFYILERYGNFTAHIRANEALNDLAGSQIASVYSAFGEQREALTPRQRGEVAEWVASAKVVSTDTSLKVTAGIFEVLGARATAKKYGFDRFWRDVRTHTLHDPVAYKNRELGRFKVLDEVPEPTWYT